MVVQGCINILRFSNWLGRRQYIIYIGGRQYWKYYWILMPRSPAGNHSMCKMFSDVKRIYWGLSEGRELKKETFDIYLFLEKLNPYSVHRMKEHKTCNQPFVSYIREYLLYLQSVNNIKRQTIFLTNCFPNTKENRIWKHIVP